MCTRYINKVATLTCCQCGRTSPLFSTIQCSCGHKACPLVLDTLELDEKMLERMIRRVLESEPAGQPASP
jgi:hypothetical protein